MNPTSASRCSAAAGYRGRWYDFHCQGSRWRPDRECRSRLGPCLLASWGLLEPPERDGACNGDGWSCWYPWIGYHLTGVRRGACFAL